MIRIMGPAAGLAMANVTNAACRAGAFVLLARATTAESVGLFALASAIAAPVQLLSDMRLRHIVATDTERVRTTEVYTSANTLTGAMAVLTLFAISGVAAVFDRSDLAAILCLVSLSKLAESYNNLAQGEYQRRRQYSVLARSVALKAFLGLTGFAAGLAVQRSVTAALIGLAIGNLTAVLVFDRARDGVSFASIRDLSSAAVRQIVRLAAPLGLVALAASLNTVVVRYVLAAHIGTSSLAVYSAAEYLVAPLAIATLTVTQLKLSDLGRASALRDIRSFKLGFRSAQLGIVAITAVMLAGAVVGGEAAMSMLFGANYGEGASVLVALVVWGGMSSLAGFGGQALTARGQNGVQVPISLASLIAGTAAALVLVPTMGIDGGAVALLIGASVHLTAIHVALRRSNSMWPLPIAADRPPAGP